MRRVYFILLIVGILLISGIGCNKAIPTSPPVPSPEALQSTPISGTYEDPEANLKVSYKDIVIAPNVKVLKSERALLMPTRGKIILKETDKNILGYQNFNPGDIIILWDESNKNSMIRKITGIKRTNRDVILDTEPATYENVFLSGTIQVEKFVSVRDYPELIDANRSTLNVDISKRFSKKLYHDSLEVSGRIGLGIKVVLSIKFKHGNLHHIYFKTTGSPYVETNLDLIDALEAHEKIFKKRFEPVRFTIWVGIVPVVISFPLTLKSGVHIEIGNGLSVGGSARVSLGGSLSWTKGYETRKHKWTSIRFTPSYDLPQVEGKGYVYLSAKLDTLIYELCGPYVEVVGGMGAKITPMDSPKWKVYGYGRSGLGFEFDALGLDWELYYELWKHVIILKEGY